MRKKRYDVTGFDRDDPCLLMDFLNLPFSNEKYPPYDKDFFKGIDIFGANRMVLAWILSFFSDQGIIYEELYGSDKSRAVCEKSFMKIEKEFAKLLAADMPQIGKDIIAKELERINCTKLILTRKPDRFGYKSLTQMLTHQAYVLFEYLKKVRLNKFYDPNDYRLEECTDKEIHKTIGKIFRRVYPKGISKFTQNEIKDLVDNAQKLETWRIEKLEETIKILSKTILPSSS